MVLPRLHAPSVRDTDGRPRTWFSHPGSVWPRSLETSGRRYPLSDRYYLCDNTCAFCESCPATSLLPTPRPPAPILGLPPHAPSLSRTPTRWHGICTSSRVIKGCPDGQEGLGPCPPGVGW